MALSSQDGLLLLPLLLAREDDDNALLRLRLLLLSRSATAVSAVIDDRETLANCDCAVLDARAVMVLAAFLAGIFRSSSGTAADTCRT